MFSRDAFGRPLRWPLVWVLGPLVLGGLLVTLLVIGVRATQGFPDIELAEQLEQLAAEGDPLLADVTDFGWDRVCVFAPYTTKEAVDERLGFTWGVVGGDMLETDDLVVFVDDDGVVKHFYLRGGVLGGPPAEGECHGRTDEATRL